MRAGLYYVRTVVLSGSCRGPLVPQGVEFQGDRHEAPVRQRQRGVERAESERRRFVASPEVAAGGQDEPGPEIEGGAPIRGRGMAELNPARVAPARRAAIDCDRSGPRLRFLVSLQRITIVRGRGSALRRGSLRMRP